VFLCRLFEWQLAVNLRCLRVPIWILLLFFYYSISHTYTISSLLRVIPLQWIMILYFYCNGFGHVLTSSPALSSIPSIFIPSTCAVSQRQPILVVLWEISPLKLTRFWCPTIWNPSTNYMMQYGTRSVLYYTRDIPLIGRLTAGARSIISICVNHHLGEARHCVPEHELQNSMQILFNSSIDASNLGLRWIRIVHFRTFRGFGSSLLPFHSGVE